MVLKIISLFFICTCSLLAAGQTVPADSIPLIDSGSISLSQYAGKKIMLITIPVNHSEADSLTLINTEAIYQQYKDSMVFIAVPSYEDGYADTLQPAIKSWYRDTLHLSFIITTGMYTYNSSGSQQAYLFQWLTTETLNGHFGADVTGNWHKFLLNAAGGLNGVFSEGTKLSVGLIDAINRAL